MQALRTLLASLQAHWPALLFTLLVAATVGLVGMIPPEVFTMLQGFLEWTEERVPQLQDNFAFLLGIGPFYAAVALGAGLMGALAGFLAIERSQGLARRLAGACTLATLTIMGILTIICSLSGAPIVAPLAAGMFSNPLPVAISCGLLLILTIVGLALLAGQGHVAIGTMTMMTRRVPSWLAGAGLTLTALALYSWFMLDPIRPTIYVLSASTASLLALAIPGVIEEARRRA